MRSNCEFKVIFTVLCLVLAFDYSDCQNKSVHATECFIPASCPCCKTGTCPSDGSGNCGGNCLDGYHGGKCRNRCPSKCVICVDVPQADSVATCTQCKDGYYSTTSLYQCQLSCPNNCKICYSDTGCTSCTDGFDLTNSNQCNPRNCSNGCMSQKCTAPTGACLFGCKKNYTGANCDTCVDGSYGEQCNIDCNHKCGSRCDKITGICHVCSPGYHGPFCSRKCHDNCELTCNKATGQCDTCKDGYYGNNCTLECQTNCQKCSLNNDTCTACIDGYHGDSCEKNCSDNCVTHTCDKKNGSCDCVAGYEGDSCDRKVTTSTTGTTVGLPVVVTAEPNTQVGAMVGGTVGGMVIIGLLGLVAVFLLRRRSAHKYVRYDIQFDCYKLDPSQTDILEENDEFDPTYFTGTVDDTKKPCGKLPVRELAKFVDSHSEDFYQEEFLRLPRGLIKSYEDAKKDENIVKNRYTGIYPYDEHRVKLLPPGSDFINACYLDGFKRKKEYIASLGPTVKAMEHFRLFWRMVWQEKTDVIVMVTNLMEGQSMKCEQYWPDIATSSTYDDITVTSLKEDFYAEFVVRTLSLTRDGEQRELHHVHFIAWPDKRVPDELTSLIELRQKVKAIKPVLGGPTIVHCSAGIGRTGTYIALDILIHQGKAQKALDIFDWVTRMREQRTSMVQTWPQYEYLHHALVHALTYHCEPIKAKKFQHFMDKADNNRMTGLFKQLHEKSERMTESEREAREMNRGLEGMNRDGADIPGNQHRPYLHLDKKYGESNYINAVYVNSFTVKNRFLIAQTPLPETVKDFLTLITQVTCSCIVSMDPPGLRDQTIGEYYPTTPGDVFTHPSYVFEVEAQELDTNSSYSLRRLTVHFNKRSGSTSRTVYHFQCQHWPQGNQVPNVTLFLQLVQDVEAMADRDMDRGPVLVHCLNAAGRSGLFCAVSNLIQKMRLEGEVSVVNTLRQIKIRRPLAIPTKDQYVFCYQSVLEFVKSEAENNEENVYGNV